MIDVIRAVDRHFSDLGWLKTYWLFSFAEYFDPQNIQFGALRVFNDDVVAPGTGFPTHPHEEMEIITVVLDGEMTHEDSMGNGVVIKAGDVQRLSAGTGLTHSEFNRATRPVHFYQIWILPDKPGLAPTYDQRTFAPSEWKNRLMAVASGQDVKDVVTIHADATISRCALEAGRQVTYGRTKGRRVFVYVTEGQISVNGSLVDRGDQARIDIDEPLVLDAGRNAEFILIDVPSRKGYGYSKETLRAGRK